MTTSIADWLKQLDLERYTALFIDNEVDLQTLKVLSDADLKEMGLPFGPRKRLLAALQQGHGRPVATPEGERRQLTVLFCDMVGFTELTLKVDPELLQSIVRRYEEACAACISRYDGYVYRLLGDGILAFFGFPWRTRARLPARSGRGWKSSRRYRTSKYLRSAVSGCESELPLESSWWRPASAMSWAKP